MATSSLSVYVCVVCGLLRERGINHCGNCGTTQEGRTINVTKQFNYWLLFQRGPEGIQQVSSFVGKLRNMHEVTATATTPHMLARDVATLLPVLFHTLHLPRTPFDLARQPWAALAEVGAQDLPQKIIIAPVDLAISNDANRFRDEVQPVLVFAPENAIQDVAACFPTTSVVGLSEAQPSFLQTHWEAVARTLNIADKRMVYGPKPCLEHDKAGVILPIRFLSRLRAPGAMEGPNFEEQGLFGGWFQHVETIVTNSAIRQGLDHEQITDHFFNSSELVSSTRISLTVALPGVSRSYSSRYSGDISFHWGASKSWLGPHDDDADLESMALDFLITHHALSKQGIGIRLPVATEELFKKLIELEHYFLNKRPKPRIVWKILTELSALAGKDLFTHDDLRRMLKQSFSSVTVFGGFPLGLVVPPDGTSPLATMVPVVYRPLMPLTHAVVDEAGPPFTARRGSLRSPMTVMVAECLRPDDPIRAKSDAIWPKLEKILKVPQNNQLKTRAINSASDLSEGLREIAPHILIISAHGFYNQSTCVSGIVINSVPHIGDELGQMPPIVILSACYTSPRGTGAINITDMMLRSGAVVVVGTQTPIDVRRNGAFLEIFFENLMLRANRKIPGRTLLDVWQRTILLGVLYDILYTSKRIRKWFHSARIDEVQVSDILKDEALLMRIRPGHAYDDWKEILIEIAEKSKIGKGVSVRNAIELVGIIPETMFYSISGRPESVIIGDVVHFAGEDAWISQKSSMKGST